MPITQQQADDFTSLVRSNASDSASAAKILDGVQTILQVAFPKHEPVETKTVEPIKPEPVKK